MKNLFKNRYGLVRSGWIILICMLLFYALLYAIPELILGILRKILVMTGDMNDAAEYYSPFVNTLNDKILPLGFQILTEVITIAIPLAAWKIMKYPLKDIGLRDFKSKFKKEGVIGLLLGLGWCTLIFLVLLITKSVRVDSVNFQFSLSLFGWIFALLLVGFAEELFNRGLLMSVLRRTNNRLLIVVLPSVVFGLIHLMNPHVTFIAIFNIILIGIVFSYIYYKSGNLWMCIGYHISWNIFQSIVFGMPVSGLDLPSIVKSHYPSDTLLNGGGFGIEGGILTTIVFILTLLFVIYYHRDSEYQFLPDPHSQGLPHSRQD